MPSRLALANAIRMLSVDAVQQANSGHPGMPMGMADIAEVLWNDFLRHNPANPNWANRDRFVLSNGHGSMLLYSLLHLTGYKLGIDDLKAFRQLYSKTPGHPEYGYAPGIETTTGPLGQGLANGVGMAIAEKRLAAEFNQGGIDIVDHYTYVFAGDGCLMEGISHEVASLAGTLGLGKLILFYDDNGISIDGDVSGWFTDDTVKRFESYHWHVLPDIDGHDPQAIATAVEEARSFTDKPSIICCKTRIGYGSPKFEGTHHSHGSPLGYEEISVVRNELDWAHEPFVISDPIYKKWDAKKLGKTLEKEWNEKFERYSKSNPVLAEEFLRRVSGKLPKNWKSSASELLAACQADQPNSVATRKASENALNAFAPLLPEFMGGSADLTGSNNTWTKLSRSFSATEPDGNYVHYGVREFGMFAIMNGMALHGGFLPYGGTFLTFVDYGRNAVRLAAMMKQRVVFVLTHDSIGLGEDGPTHQPVEHAAMLRLTPNVYVWRPCDEIETMVAWKWAIEKQDAPTCLLLTRQKLPAQERDKKMLSHVEKGGYVLIEPQGDPESIIIATGSEVYLAVEAANTLNEKGHKIRVVSMPSTTLFDDQPKRYQDSVLPPKIKARVAVEAAIADYWYKYVGMEGKIIGMHTYGESAPAADVYEAKGITVAEIIKAIKSF